MNTIKITGAGEHNLKNIDLEIPKNKLVVFTGVSGSGKTSLAMDTIFAEGQRRYVESLSSYARQFLGVLKKPNVERIDGLSPAIAIDQKGSSHNPRSTVGTVTEIYDYLRLLFARIGHPHCPKCGQEVAPQSAPQIVDQILGWPINKKRGLRLMILSPVVRGRRGEYSSLFVNLKKQGYTQVRIDGQFREIDADLVLIKTNKHNIDVVVDKLVVQRITPDTKRRLTDSLEKALKLADGLVIVSKILDKSFSFPSSPKKFEDKLYSEKYACPKCNMSLPDLEPRMFSFNSPHGACPQCEGLGRQQKVDPQLLVNPRLSVNQGGILPWTKVIERSGWTARIIRQVAKEEKIDLNKSIENLSPRDLDKLLYGTGKKIYQITGRDRYGKPAVFNTKFEGVVNNLERRYKETRSDYIRKEIEKYMVNEPCSKCKGSRLRDEALSVMIRGKNISNVTKMMIKSTHKWALTLKQKQGGLTKREVQIARPIVDELVSRLKFLDDVGLSYLSLDRSARTLSSGESQRIRLASQIGTGLSGVLYVLDEPSVGLHHRDQSRLIDTLKRLKDLGNNVLVVEHDEATIRSADWIVDFGPGAGERGGKVVAQGTPAQIVKNNKSLTGQYLSGQKKVVVSAKTKKPAAKTQKLVISGCREHNLKNITVEIPLGKFVCVTGVSGSGKSTLVNDTLYRALRAQFGLKITELPGDHDELMGSEYIDKLIRIDQSPIGRTPRSNPATYTKTFDDIRHLFSQTKEAKIRGYQSGRFSFNVKGGRCEACRGEGQLKVEMQFLPDVYVDCEVCKGRRYNRETLEVRYKGQSIADVLAMSIDEAREFFNSIPPIRKRLQTMIDVGLGYIKLGQPAPTLSGGEAQRIKLSRELGKRPTGNTFYLLDEPTTGLHFDDLKKLLVALRRLVSRGNTVLVIEHNLDVIKNADWIIDLGPEGGDEGGEVVATGTVEDIMRVKKSYTGQALQSQNSNGKTQN